MHGRVSAHGVLRALGDWFKPGVRRVPSCRVLSRSAHDALCRLSDDDLRRTDWHVAVPLSTHVAADGGAQPELADVVDAAAPRTGHFLRVVAPGALARILELGGVLERLARLGYDPRLRVETGHPLGDRLVITDPGFAQPLCDLRLHRARRPLPAILDDIGPPDVIDLLFVEWLSMQHPRGEFSAARPRLPGQEFPGLGLGRHVADLLLLAAHRLGVEGVLNRPRYYHNAELYASRFHYLDPVHEGYLIAARRDLRSHGFAERSWLFETGALWRDGTPGRWRFWGGEQVMPTSSRLTRGFGGRRYRRAAREAAAAVQFRAASAR